jgi:dihydrofolate reductase
MESEAKSHSVGRKTIFAINVTMDGFADHTAVIADDELHDFYTNLLGNVGVELFGRKTYQLMESFWPNAPSDPRSSKSMIEFANKINSIPKIVLSNTLNEVHWNNTKLVKGSLLDEVFKLKNQEGKSVSIGGLSVAATLMKHDLIDEYWFLVQPVILGKGRNLFERLDSSIHLKLADTRKLNSGVVVLHYKKGNIK